MSTTNSEAGDISAKPNTASARTTIRNKYGFHVRPSTSFSQLAATFSSDIQVTAGEMTADAKSIIGLLTLGALCGTSITINAKGDDAAAAVQALKELVESSFNGIE